MITHGSTFLTPPMRIHPSDEKKFKIFLAGSIEMGSAEPWQTEILNMTIGKNHVDEYLFFNPRRPDWDSSWEQSIDNPQFKEQVLWELDMSDQCDMILMYFDPNTKSPITLMELGLYATKLDIHFIVCCPEGFWRKGNVDIVCERYDIINFSDKEDFIKYVDFILK